MMEVRKFLAVKNNSAVKLSEIPELDFIDFRQELIDLVNGGNMTVAAFFCDPGENNVNRLYAVLLDKTSGNLLTASAAVGESFESLTPEAPAFHWFEREINEDNKVEALKHPWLKPIRFDHPSDQPGVTDYFTMQGAAAHEVAVGPVHAGVIEPGHFRFQCMGEDVYSLEIELGYQHRGLEHLLQNGPDAKTQHLLETAAGDSSIASALAYDGIVRSLTALPELPERVQILRTIALELERIANHTGDLGALAGDVAFLPTMSYCGRIRGEFLNMTALLCGNRFGRGYITPDGVSYDLSDENIARLSSWFEQTVKELNNALELMFDAPTVLDRFENTGAVDPAVLQAIGAVGVAARAGGWDCDIRRDCAHAGCYDRIDWSVATCESADVLARAMMRKLELAESADIIRQLLKKLPETANIQPEFTRIPTLQSDSLAIALTEGWRGMIAHIAITDGEGRFKRYKVVDPSFHNWFALAMALRSEQISNFPICNKSFNLSYCGHDL